MSKELRISLAMLAALMLCGIAVSARAGSPKLNGGFNGRVSPRFGGGPSLANQTAHTRNYPVLGSRLNVPAPAPIPRIAGGCAQCTP
jgi:hypothetical protein